MLRSKKQNINCFCTSLNACHTRFPLANSPVVAAPAVGDASLQAPAPMYAPPAFAMGPSLDGPETQWVISTIGDLRFLDHATVERQYPDSVTVMSGEHRDHKLGWSAPPNTKDGELISVTIH